MLIFSRAAARTMAERKLSTETSLVPASGIFTAKPGAESRRSSIMSCSKPWCLPLRDFLRPPIAVLP